MDCAVMERVIHKLEKLKVDTAGRAGYWQS
jgi:hypothetical protein